MDRSNALEVFSRYLDEVDRGKAPPWEEVCGAHPQLSDQLEALRSEWASVELLCEKFGVTTAAEGEDFPMDPEMVRLVQERVDRLRALTPGSPTYQRKEIIGQGGMATVYRALDLKFQRHLALKVVRSDQSQRRGTEAARANARFIAEAQIAGKLDHPGIVPVHDLGIDEHGDAFFTMRLVSGTNLSRVFHWSRENQKGWSLTRALQSLLRVCEAVAYAHSHEITHRDLKPSNVMVGSFGETYVVDWGLARVVSQEPGEISPAPTEESLAESGRASFTRTGTITGTPAYMAPEQAEGAPPGPLMDVYSLGAMLYQLLTGVPPYSQPGRSTSAETVLKELRQGPPTPVERLHSEAPLELAAICEKAMRRAPDQRYQRPDEMAEDLQAYLDNRVVKAHRTGALIELRKWVHRNKGMAASLAVAILAAFSAVVILAVKNTQLEASRQLESTARAAAEENAELARQRIRQLERVRDFLSGLFRSENPFSHELGDALQGFEAVPQPADTPRTIREVLDRAAGSLNSLVQDPLLQAELAMILGSVYTKLLDFDQARPLLNRAVALFSEHKKPTDPDTLQAQKLAARCALDSDDLQEAKELLNADWLRTIEGLDHDDPEILRVYLSSLHTYAMLQARLFNGEHARELAAKTSTIARERLGLTDRLSRTFLADYGLTCEITGRLDEAKETYLETLDAFLASGLEQHPEADLVRQNLADVEFRLGNVDAAAELGTEILKYRLRVHGGLHPLTRATVSKLGTWQLESRQILAAQVFLQDRVKESASQGGEHSFLSRALLALYYYKSRQCSKTLEATQSLYPEIGNYLPQPSEEQELLLQALVRCAVETRSALQIEWAEGLYDATLELYDVEHDNVLRAAGWLGLAYHQHDQNEDAIVLLEETLEAVDGLRSGDDLKVQEVRYVLTLSLIATEDFERAAAVLDDLLTLGEPSSTLVRAGQSLIPRIPAEYHTTGMQD